MRAYCLKWRKLNTERVRLARRLCAGLPRLFCPTHLPLIPFQDSQMPRPMVAALHSDDKVKPGTHSWGKSQTAISLESLPRRCRRCANYFGADAADSPTQKIHCKDQYIDDVSRPASCEVIGSGCAWALRGLFSQDGKQPAIPGSEADPDC